MAYIGTVELARVLGIRAPTEQQRVAMTRVLDAAAFEINMECGSIYMGTVAEELALLAEVNLDRANEHWAQAETPFGLIGLGDSVPIMAPRDTWDRHAQKLAPLKRSWGFA
jgi:hypothetical protein